MFSFELDFAKSLEALLARETLAEIMVTGDGKVTYRETDEGPIQTLDGVTLSFPQFRAICERVAGKFNGRVDEKYPVFQRSWDANRIVEIVLPPLAVAGWLRWRQKEHWEQFLSDEADLELLYNASERLMASDPNAAMDLKIRILGKTHSHAMFDSLVIEITHEGTEQHLAQLETLATQRGGENAFRTAANLLSNRLKKGI